MTRPPCSHPDCSGQHYARGLCRLHYVRARVAGTLDVLPQFAIENVLERFAAKSAWRGECLVWTGAVDDDGYGKTSVRGYKLAVHRAAWIERHGEPPPETPHVLHHCDNPPCWRDEHLWLGTPADNSADMITKGRARCGHGKETHCPRGHPYSGDNLRILASGGRACRQCDNDAHNRRYAASRGGKVRPYDRTNRRRLFRQNQAGA